MPNHDYPYTPVPFTQVQITDAFWQPRIETNRTVTIPSDLKKCEETDRVANFDRAAGRLEGPFVGDYEFNDSDVFKTIEGAAYSLQNTADPALEAYIDTLIARIAAAQEPDGYLYTPRTIDPDHVPPHAGRERWSSLTMSHELYTPATCSRPLPRTSRPPASATSWRLPSRTPTCWSRPSARMGCGASPATRRSSWA